ncbi:epidermal retinol dehydrogenase 2 isoform X2 [Equus asinus]|uniref:epidermal retinol dehydrogenase 2 isoform X2 n=1 Tax=Equus asinus TaxID=9793 RepID=UPI0038F72AA1
MFEIPACTSSHHNRICSFQMWRPRQKRKGARAHVARDLGGPTPAGRGRRPLGEVSGGRWDKSLNLAQRRARVPVSLAGERGFSAGSEGSVSGVKREVGDISILINNAGIVTGKNFLDCPDELIEKSFDVNFKAHLWTYKAFLPAMIANDHGHLVCISSSAGLTGVNGLADYCASKFAAFGFAEAVFAETVAQKQMGIKTTIVCPLLINTGMFEGCTTKFPSLLPVLEPEYAVRKIVDAILQEKVYLYIPRVLYFLVFLKRLPWRRLTMPIAPRPMPLQANQAGNPDRVLSINSIHPFGWLASWSRQQVAPNVGHKGRVAKERRWSFSGAEPGSGVRPRKIPRVGDLEKAIWAPSRHLKPYHEHPTKKTSIHVGRRTTGDEVSGSKPEDYQNHIPTATDASCINSNLGTNKEIESTSREVVRTRKYICHSK